MHLLLKQLPLQGGVLDLQVTRQLLRQTMHPELILVPNQHRRMPHRHLGLNEKRLIVALKHLQENAPKGHLGTLVKFFAWGLPVVPTDSLFQSNGM